MRILVGNNALAAIGGSETYTYTIVEELVRRNHDVSCIAPRIKGIVAWKIKELGVPVYNRPIKQEFDLILMSHSTSIGMIKGCKGFKVQTCHGIYPRVEQPVAGMDAYVAISEEVKHHLSTKGYESTLITNGVNCGRFSAKRDISDSLGSILSLSHNKIVNDFLVEICDELGHNLVLRNKFHKPKWNIEDYIDQADLVVSLGRGCYESMAMGRNVIIYDNRKYSHQGSIGDGFVTLENIGKYLQNNCSGRYSKRSFTKDEFIAELSKYDQSTGENLRQYALNNLNIRTQVEKYLNIIR